jgi:hypothetical protein
MTAIWFGPQYGASKKCQKMRVLFLKGVFDRAVVINGSSRDSAIDTPS